MVQIGQSRKVVARDWRREILKLVHQGISSEKIGRTSLYQMGPSCVKCRAEDCMMLEMYLVKITELPMEDLYSFLHAYVKLQ